eukprot:jgi/Bigna1/78744/fgenesh1_pg.56_\
MAASSALCCVSTYLNCRQLKVMIAGRGDNNHLGPRLSDDDDDGVASVEEKEGPEYDGNEEEYGDGDDSAVDKETSQERKENGKNITRINHTTLDNTEEMMMIPKGLKDPLVLDFPLGVRLNMVYPSSNMHKISAINISTKLVALFMLKKEQEKKEEDKKKAAKKMEEVPPKYRSIITPFRFPVAQIHELIDIDINEADDIAFMANYAEFYPGVAGIVSIERLRVALNALKIALPGWPHSDHDISRPNDTTNNAEDRGYGDHHHHRDYSTQISSSYTPTIEKNNSNSTLWDRRMRRQVISRKKKMMMETATIPKKEQRKWIMSCKHVRMLNADLDNSNAGFNREGVSRRSSNDNNIAITNEEEENNNKEDYYVDKKEMENKNRSSLRNAIIPVSADFFWCTMELLHPEGKITATVDSLKITGGENPPYPSDNTSNSFGISNPVPPLSQPSIYAASRNIASKKNNRDRGSYRAQRLPSLFIEFYGTTSSRAVVRNLQIQDAKALPFLTPLAAIFPSFLGRSRDYSSGSRRSSSKDQMRQEMNAKSFVRALRNLAPTVHCRLEDCDINISPPSFSYDDKKNYCVDQDNNYIGDDDDVDDQSDDDDEDGTAAAAAADDDEADDARHQTDHPEHIVHGQHNSTREKRRRRRRRRRALNNIKDEDDEKDNDDTGSFSAAQSPSVLMLRIHDAEVPDIFHLFKAPTSREMQVSCLLSLSVSKDDDDKRSTKEPTTTTWNDEDAEGGFKKHPEPIFNILPATRMSIILADGKNMDTIRVSALSGLVISITTDILEEYALQRRRWMMMMMTMMEKKRNIVKRNKGGGEQKDGWRAGEFQKTKVVHSNMKGWKFELEAKSLEIRLFHSSRRAGYPKSARISKEPLLKTISDNFRVTFGSEHHRAGFTTSLQLGYRCPATNKLRSIRLIQHPPAAETKAKTARKSSQQSSSRRQRYSTKMKENQQRRG